MNVTLDLIFIASHRACLEDVLNLWICYPLGVREHYERA
jgi:hypothetical protein